MIYTLTFNPSLDYLLDTPGFAYGKTNRSTSESLHFGGKGINVSYVLKQLGTSSTCLGFVAGFTGTELENMLDVQGLCHDFVHVEKGNTRINVKIKSSEITEINANGCEIAENDVKRLFEKLDKISDGDTLVLAGSTPKGFDNAYPQIVSRLFSKNIRFVIDTSGQKLLDCLKYKPFLIKPNKDELSEIVGQTLETYEEIITAARKLKDMGAVNVLVSMGGDGALLVDENNEVHRVFAHKITPVSTVGAGDSMVAGFLAGTDKGYDYALKLGNACGAATASVEILADREKIESMM
ncbi:MAG: 1-phosphofructokinase [Clostridia bacterium]|nr:1-phosphofructokinase [Clostridia bacterium]